MVSPFRLSSNLTNTSNATFTLGTWWNFHQMELTLGCCYPIVTHPTTVGRGLVQDVKTVQISWILFQVISFSALFRYVINPGFRRIPVENQQQLLFLLYDQLSNEWHYRELKWMPSPGSVESLTGLTFNTWSMDEHFVRIAKKLPYKHVYLHVNAKA